MRERLGQYLTLRWLAAAIAVTPVLPPVTGAAVSGDPLAQRSTPAAQAAVAPAHGASTTFADPVGRPSPAAVNIRDGRPVEDSAHLPAVVAATPAGKTVTVAMLRDGKGQNLAVTIGRMPAEGRS